MNPSAIYSKSGKGVQEASGKTSLLKRAERAVLSAIDGRSTLGEVAQKVGKAFDGAFEALIAQLDRDGFIREVAAANAPAPAAPRPSAPAAKKSAAKSGSAPSLGEDLDFTGIMAAPLQAPKPAADPAAALYKARQEAEARAAEERERLRAEAEAKARAEAEAKARVEAEKKLREETAARARAEAEAKAKAAREEALRIAEAKARLEAEAKARIEAERRAREEAERKAREEAERARREAEELRQRLEEERKAREEAERRAREEAERKAREEAERKAREEAERRAREEAERKAKEEAERKAREEAERKAREEAERKAREEAERKARAEHEAQMRRAREEAERKRAEAERRKAKEQARREAGEPEAEPLPAIAAPEPRSAKPGGENLDALMADLDSFTQRDDEDTKAREEAESRAQEEKQRGLREEGERRERERAERERQEADDRRAREKEERRAREEEERRAREEEERERAEMEERARRAVEAFAAQEASGSDDIGVTDSDLDMDDVRRDQAAVPKESRKAQREREQEQKRLEKEARQRARAAARAEAKAAKSKAKAADDSASVKVTKVRRRRSWGRPAATALLLLVAAGLGALHLMPISTDAYQRAASEALRQPVRVGSARLSLWSGIQVNLKDLRIGEGTRVASARAYPELASLLGDTHDFKRIELDGVTLRQDALGETLLARVKGPRFSVERIVVKDLKLDGPLPLPLLQADVRLANDGSVRAVQLQGPEELIGQLLPKGEGVDFDVTAAAFALPFAPEISLTSFAMKGRATRYGMRIESWGGAALGGALSGTANVRWGSSWQVDGVLTARAINAAAFAPALLSEGHAEGTGKFSMSGADPAKLVRTGRVEGSFTIGKGVLGSFDLARAIRTDGREVNGRTQFVEMNGQGTYDRGAVALRNVVIGAGALQAGASADISQSGALSGRIVADVRTASQSLRATLLLGGTVKDPKVRN
jgi:hypothetical protein